MSGTATYSLPKTAAPKLEALVDQIVARPGDLIDLKVMEAPPGHKGDTAQGGSKPATLETGLVVQVPLFVDAGETIKVDTRTGEYLSRG